MKMTPCGYCDWTHRGAMVLNNYGVALLAHGNFYEAMVTLRDAVQTMKQCFHRTDDKLSQERNLANIQVMIQEAAARLAEPKIRKLPTSSRKVKIHIITDEESCVTNDVAITHPTSNNSSHSPPTSPAQAIIFPIHIDACNKAQYTQNEAEFDSAIVMYNFALSQWCCFSEEQLSYTVSSEEEGKRSAKSMILHVLRLSNDVLNNLLEQSCDEYDVRRIACIKAAVLHMILQLLAPDHADKNHSANTESRELETARQFYQKRLHDVQRSICLLDQEWSHQCGFAAPAAAAA